MIAKIFRYLINEKNHIFILNPKILFLEKLEIIRNNKKKQQKKKCFKSFVIS